MSNLSKHYFIKHSYKKANEIYFKKGTARLAKIDFAIMTVFYQSTTTLIFSINQALLPTFGTVHFFR